MEKKTVNESQYYVVHFVQKPFKTIDHYICVPFHWAIHKFTDKKVVVAYPKREDPIMTRERVKNKEKYKDDWNFYSADLKYQTNTYDDAERWISKENNHRLLVQENSSRQQNVLKDQESGGSNQKQSLKSKDKSESTGKPYQIPQKSSLNDTDKRSSDETKKQIILKRVSWSTTKTAMSTAQSTAAANGVKSTEGSSQSSKKNNHKPREPDPSLPVIELGKYTEVINSNGHSQQEQPTETNGSRNQQVTNLTGAPKPPSPVEQTTQLNQHNSKKLRVPDIETLKTPSNNQEPRVADQIDNLKKNMAITSQKPLNRIDPTKPLPMPSSRLLLSTQKPSLANIQNPRHQGPSIANNINCCTPVGGMHVARTNIVPVTEPRSVLTAASVTNIPKPHQHPVFVRQNVQQNLPAPQEHMQQTRKQELPSKPTGHRPDPRLCSESRPISELTQHQPIRPSSNNNPTNVPSQFHQPPEIQHRGQKTVSQQDAQRSQRPVYIPVLPTNSKPTASNSTSYQSSRIELPRIDQNVDQYPRIQTQQVNRSNETNLTKKRHLEDDTVRSATYKTRLNNIRSQTILCMQEPSLPNHSAALDSELDTDHKTAFSYEMSVDEAHEKVNETNQTEHYLVDRSIAQNFLTKLAMQQQIVERFITNYTQVTSNFQDMINTFNSLRNFLSETAKSYQKFIDNERINTSKNSASPKPSSSNATQEVSSVVEKRQTAVPERRNSSNRNQSSNDVTKAPETTPQRDSRQHPNSTQQFALPLEYDSNDTRWTLKYQAHRTGLQELLPNSNIYVRYSELKHFEQVSNSYQSLARLLLHEVFNEKALRVCATMTEIVELHSKMSPDGRPALDNVGFFVLLNFVIQYASRSGWCVDVSEIINAINQEVKKVRI